MVADIVAEGVQYMALALGGGIASFNFMHIAIPKLFDRADTDSAAAYDRWKLGRAERFGQQIAQVAAERKLDRPTKEAPADQVLPFCTSDVPAISKLPDPEVVRSLWNLIRLGLVSPENTHGGDKRLLFVALTSLGVGLVEACTSPREA